MMMVREQGLCYTAFIQQVFMEYWSRAGASKHWGYSSGMGKVPNSIGVYIVLEGNREKQISK